MTTRNGARYSYIRAEVVGTAGTFSAIALAADKAARSGIEVSLGPD